MDSVWTFPELFLSQAGTSLIRCAWISRGSRKMTVEIFRFEDFELDLSACELRRGGTALHLQRIPFQLLSLLVERHGQLVTREEILERIWGKDVFVDGENSINTAVYHHRAGPRLPLYRADLTASADPICRHL